MSVSGGPTVRLAVVAAARSREVFRPGANSAPPALLASFYYLPNFLAQVADLEYRDWALDSGAYSAHSQGVSISLPAYLDEAKRLATSAHPPSEVFALDVIGDARASRANAEASWAAGVEVIPCFHFGTPWDELVSLAREYPKVALGGCARAPVTRKLAWAQEAFRRVWASVGPRKIHGFGFGAARFLEALPWHSVDSSSWEFKPAKFGAWSVYGHLPKVAATANALRSEVEHFLAIERAAQSRWAKEIERMGRTPSERKST